LVAVAAILESMAASCPWEGRLTDVGVSAPPLATLTITIFICNFFIAIAAAACYNESSSTHRSRSDSHDAT
jgi:hypothetical protein